NHGRVVGTHTVACVAIDACAKRFDFASLQVYHETFDVRGLTIVSEEVGDVFLFVAVDACYLLVPILVSEEWLRYASAKGDQVWLIVLVPPLLKHLSNSQELDQKKARRSRLSIFSILKD